MVGLLVVTDDEWSAAKRIFPAMSKIGHTSYHYVDPARTTEVLIRKLPDRGNLPAQETTRFLLEDYRPSFVFLFGTAGGVSRDGLKLGDVVIGDHIEYAAFKKIITAKGWWQWRQPPPVYKYRVQPADHPSLYLRDDFGQSRRDSAQNWRTKIQARRPDTRDLVIHTGQILAGDAILSAPDAEEQIAMLARFDKGLVVETEAQGLARAIFSARKDPTYNPLYLVVRGVSDMIDGGAAETERKAWSDYAAEAAGRLVADVVDELLEVHKP